jgi:hypothetical protein
MFVREYLALNWNAHQEGAKWISIFYSVSDAGNPAWLQTPKGGLGRIALDAPKAEGCQLARNQHSLELRCASVEADSDGCGVRESC